MNTKPRTRFSPIVERIEYVRGQLGLNKSRFSAEIGMKPQTYNNFIGSQGSKPNVELIVGIVNTFNINPMWLLNGIGQVFLEDAGQSRVSQKGPYAAGRAAALRESSGLPTPFPPGADPEVLKAEISNLEPILQRAENQIRRAEIRQVPAIDRALNLIYRFYEADPTAVLDEVRTLLDRLQERIKD